MQVSLQGSPNRTTVHQPKTWSYIMDSKIVHVLYKTEEIDRAAIGRGCKYSEPTIRNTHQDKLPTKLVLKLESCTHLKLPAERVHIRARKHPWDPLHCQEMALLSLSMPCLGLHHSGMRSARKQVAAIVDEAEVRVPPVCWMGFPQWNTLLVIQQFAMENAPFVDCLYTY